MKMYFSFTFMLFFFSSFFNDSMISPEKTDAVTTMVKICTFHSVINPGNSDCPEGTLDLQIDNECYATGAATLRMVNLAAFPTLGQEYDIPTGVPDIYYEYTTAYNGTQIIGPIDKFTYFGEVHGATGLPIFEFETKMYIDVQDPCGNYEYPVFPVNVRLVTASGALYPIDNYASPSQMFYCAVFEETCDSGTCHIPGGDCKGGSDPEYLIGACGACNNCEVRSSAGAEDLDAKLEKASFQPNPFSDVLTINYTLSQPSEVRVEMLDANGAVVKQMHTSEPAGDQFLKINTASLSSGVYFCRVKLGTQTFTEKVIKFR